MHIKPSFKEELNVFVLKTAFGNLQAMHEMLNANAASKKREWQALKERQNGVDIVTLEWLSLCWTAERECMIRNGLSQGMKSCCWNCGAHSRPFRKCGRCRRAKYCSSECRWHHKNTTSEEFKCVGT